MLPDINGNAHIIPLSTIQNIIDGKLSAFSIDDFNLILPIILKEWLDNE